MEGNRKWEGQRRGATERAQTSAVKLRQGASGCQYDSV
jgi:hypothetical protein